MVSYTAWYISTPFFRSATLSKVLPSTSMASIKPDYSIFSPEGTVCDSPLSLRHDSTIDITKMEEITGVPARAMLVQAGLLPAPPAGALVLDNACGGGVVAAQLFGAIGRGTTTSDL